MIETRRLEDLVIRNARFTGRKMAELTCLTINLNDKHNQLNTHQTGGFCLPVDDVKKLATHYPFDTKLANGIADNCFLWSNLTVTDMGAGPGHYGKFWLHDDRIETYFWSGVDRRPSDQTQAYLQRSDLFVKKMGLYHCKSVGETLRVQSQLPWFRNTIFVFAKNRVYRGFECK